MGERRSHCGYYQRWVLRAKALEPLPVLLWFYSVQFAQVEDEKEEEGEENPLLVPLEEKAVLQEEQASLWFSKVRGD